MSYFQLIFPVFELDVARQLYFEEGFHWTKLFMLRQISMLEYALEFC